MVTFNHIDKTASITGLSVAEAKMLCQALSIVAQGHQMFKAMSFSDQKKALHEMAPDTKELSNKALRTQVEAQLALGAKAEEMMNELVEWVNKNETKLSVVNE